ncbi:MAG: hypothetical protein ACT4QA_01440 [Panacagrimonas sp.]
MNPHVFDSAVTPFVRFVAAPITAALILAAGTAAATPDPYYDENGLPRVNLMGTNTVAAANPKLMFSRGTVLGVDNNVHAFTVPVTNSSGQVVNYDLVIELTPATNGIPPTSARVTAVRSPTVVTGALVAGTYNDRPLDATCNVTNVALPSGRTQTLIKCNPDGTAVNVELTVVTGAVDGTHPYFTQLSGADIHQRPDVNNYFWGITTAGFGALGGCTFNTPGGGINTGQIVSAQRNGNRIVLGAYRTNGFLDCAPAITKTN